MCFSVSVRLGGCLILCRGIMPIVLVCFEVCHILAKVRLNARHVNLESTRFMARSRTPKSLPRDKDVCHRDTNSERQVYVRELPLTKIRKFFLGRELEWVVGSSKEGHWVAVWIRKI